MITRLCKCQLREGRQKNNKWRKCTENNKQQYSETYANKKWRKSTENNKKWRDRESTKKTKNCC